MPSNFLLGNAFPDGAAAELNFGVVDTVSCVKVRIGIQIAHVPGRLLRPRMLLDWMFG
jgi:hypothetical protein